MPQDEDKMKLFLFDFAHYTWHSIS